MADAIILNDTPLVTAVGLGKRFSSLVALEGLDFELWPGEVVGLLLGAANRDPARFCDPDRFDPGRDRGGDRVHPTRRLEARALGRRGQGSALEQEPGRVHAHVIHVPGPWPQGSRDRRPS